MIPNFFEVQIKDVLLKGTNFFIIKVKKSF